MKRDSNTNLKPRKWIALLLKGLLAIMVVGAYKDLTPLILKSSSFGATVFIYFHLIMAWILLGWVLKKTGFKWHNEIQFSGIALLLMLLMAETVLRFAVQTHLDYCETSGNLYRANFFEQNISVNEIPYQPFDMVWTKKTEFNYYRVVNDKGLFEHPIPPKQQNEIRFLCLGDSFTEGVGTEYDSTWVKQVERLLQLNHTEAKITFINAGMRGNDPFGEYYLLNTKLLDYEPDWVIMVVNNSDIYEYFERGGFERYSTNGTINYRKGPWWYQAYRYSYIVRHVAHDIFNLKHYLLTEKEEQHLSEKSIRDISKTCQMLDSIGTLKNFNFLLVLQPMHSEIADSSYSFSGFRDLLNSSANTLDILPSMNRQVQRLPEGTGYYWPLDRHFNAEGYGIMANAIFEYLDEIVDETNPRKLKNETNASTNQ